MLWITPFRNGVQHQYKSCFDMELMESSFDLMQNPLFSISKRASWMMPTPFVLTDAVVIKQKIKPTIIVQTAEPISTGSATQIQPLLRNQ
jgi:hypothetical protein